MNTELFEIINADLKHCLCSCVDVLGDKEYEFRLTKINKIYSKMVKEDKILDEYYSLLHEIRTLCLLKDMGSVRIAFDSNNEIGPDFTYLDRYKIECVICTPGAGKNLIELMNSGFQKYDRKFRDNKEKFRQIDLRVTSVIEDKRVKHMKYIADGCLRDDEPYSIFVNLGQLLSNSYPGNFCNNITEILVGRGALTLRFDSTKGNQIGSLFYGHNPTMKNNNDQVIDSNIFANPDYSSISSIIVTNAWPEEKYSPKNTIVFLNPFAKNKIKVLDLGALPYWKIDNKSEYILRKKGKKINLVTD